jgi:fumarylpyruvate hydrolase
VCAEIVPMEGVVLGRGALALAVNGQVKWSNVDRPIWNSREPIADLSLHDHPKPGEQLIG